MHIYSCLFRGTASRLCEHTEPCFLVHCYKTLFSFTLTYPVMEIYSKCLKAGLPGPTSVLKHEVTRKFKDNLHTGMEVRIQTCWHIHEHDRIVN